MVWTILVLSTQISTYRFQSTAFSYKTGKFYGCNWPRFLARKYVEECKITCWSSEGPEYLWILSQFVHVMNSKMTRYWSKAVLIDTLRLCQCNLSNISTEPINLKTVWAETSLAADWFCSSWLLLKNQAHDVNIGSIPSNYMLWIIWITMLSRASSSNREEIPWNERPEYDKTLVPKLKFVETLHVVHLNSCRLRVKFYKVNKPFKWTKES